MVEKKRPGIPSGASQRPSVDDDAIDNSVPYPEAPEVDHGDLTQEHYRGARDPERAPKRRDFERSSTDRFR
jgi:hypothetical protein